MKKQILISLGVSALTIISLLLLFLTFMEGRFFPGTMVNQVDFSLMKREEAAEYFSNWKQEEFGLSLVDKEGNTELLSGKEIQLRYAPDFSAIPKPDSFLMLFSLGKQKDYPLKGSLAYDESLLRSFVEKYAASHSTDESPRAGFLSAYVPGAGYLIGEEKQGGKISAEVLENAIKNAIQEGKNLVRLEDAGVYEEAEKRENLESLKDEKNKSLPGTVRYNFSGEIVELNSDTTLSWFTEDGAKLDNQRVKEYVKNLKTYTDTSGKERSFLTEDGRVLRKKKR